MPSRNTKKTNSTYKNTNTKSQKRKKKSFLDKLIILLTLILVFLISFIAYTMVKGNISEHVQKQEVTSPTETVSKEPEEPVEEKSLDPSENKINILLMGIDKLAIHSDVNMIASFDTVTHDLCLISIPRDTKVTMTKEMTSTLNQKGKYVPDKIGYGTCKLTELYAYAGTELCNDFQKAIIEDLLGIEIDHYVTVDTAGFRDVVDAIGGVDMEVKERLYYSDPEQDLYIDLYPGFQHLDGDKAEQLVRYRDGYAAKDLKRIEVQRDFMKEMLKKLTSTETLITSAPSLIKTMFTYVKTDMSITDALGYVKYIKDVDMNKFYSETIPGEGGSYFTVDEAALDEMVQRIFYSDDPSGEKAKAEAENQAADPNEPFSGNIEVSNGGNINGLGGQKAEILTNAGYTVTSVTTYNGTQQNKTRIIVSQEGLGQDMLQYFPEAQIEVNPKLLAVGIDMKIILGLDEK